MSSSNVYRLIASWVVLVYVSGFTVVIALLALFLARDSILNGMKQVLSFGRRIAYLPYMPQAPTVSIEATVPMEPTEGEKRALLS